jgi:hypothetical protein
MLVEAAMVQARGMAVATAAKDKQSGLTARYNGRATSWRAVERGR